MPTRLLLGGCPKSRQAVESRCNAAVPHRDARTGESHSTCQKVTAQAANRQCDARFDMASLQKEHCGIGGNGATALGICGECTRDQIPETAYHHVDARFDMATWKQNCPKPTRYPSSPHVDTRFHKQAGETHIRHISGIIAHQDKQIPM